MNEIEKALGGVIARAAAVEEPGDYTQDGLLYCGHCRTPKQCRIKLGDTVRVLGCQCACAQRRYDAERAAEAERQRLYRAEQMRSAGMADKSIRGYTFAAAEHTPDLDKCRVYMNHFDEALDAGRGLLLWGNTGNGKTYAAACIANAVIDRGMPAMVTSFPRILGADWKDRAKLAEELNFYPLLVLDDLGAERGSDYALETVYRVVDERYKSGLPLIVTTNLTLEQLTKPGNMDYQRIYDRVLEMCTPLYFSGKNRRRERANKNLQWLKEITS